MFSKENICECAGIGRQARLRGVCCMTYGFKSRHSHQVKNDMTDRQEMEVFLALKPYSDYPPIDTQKIVYLSEDNLRAKIIFESTTRLFYPTKRFSDNQLTQCSDL